MTALKNKPTLSYSLSGVLAALLIVSSLVGLLYGSRGLYEPYPAALAGLVGQDAITLAVGLPLLVVSVWLTHRGSARGLLLWAGVLFYFAYSYYFYVIGGFNALFLIYIAIVSTSLYGLLSLLFALDPEEIKARFGVKTPTRLVGGFFIGYSLLFAFMWIGMSLASAATGTRPDGVLHSVVAIDLAVLLPLLIFGGLWLWRRSGWGYVLGALLLVKMATTGFTLAFNTALGWAWSGVRDPLDTYLFVLFAIMTIGALSLLVPYLGSLDHPLDKRRGKLSLSVHDETAGTR